MCSVRRTCQQTENRTCTLLRTWFSSACYHLLPTLGIPPVPQTARIGFYTRPHLYLLHYCRPFTYLPATSVIVGLLDSPATFLPAILFMHLGYPVLLHTATPTFLLYMDIAIASSLPTMDRLDPHSSVVVGCASWFFPVLVILIPHACHSSLCLLPLLYSSFD